MVNLSSYISKAFTKSFLTIFLPLFFIGSLVFIVKISTMTSYMQIDFYDMMKIFSFNIPSILFYTLPVSFMSALAITFIRLSNENELIAFFSLTIKPQKLLNPIFLIAMLFSIILLLIGLALMPLTAQQFSSFKAEKITESQLNITPSQLGQKFGDFFVFITDKDEHTMKNITIFKKEDNGSNQLFIASDATLNNINSVFYLTLNHGSGYTYDEKSFKEITYDKMEMLKDINSDEFIFKNIVEYWSELYKKGKNKILFFIFLSLLPLLSLYPIASSTIVNPRYKKTSAFFVVAPLTIFFYVISSLLEKDGTFLILSITTLSIFIVGYILFRVRVLKYF